MKSSKVIIKEVLKKIEGGSTLKVELPKYDMSIAQWYRALKESGLSTTLARGRRARVYTPEKIKIVKARVAKGEFINKICEDLGMDYKNFCRYCRKQGVKIMNKTLLKQNYKNRDYSKSGRKASNKAVSKTASKAKKTTVASKKPAQKKSKK